MTPSEIIDQKINFWAGIAIDRQGRSNIDPAGPLEALTVVAVLEIIRGELKECDGSAILQMACDRHFDSDLPLKNFVKKCKRYYAETAITEAGGIRAAADEIGVDRSTLRNIRKEPRL